MNKKTKENFKLTGRSEENNTEIFKNIFISCSSFMILIVQSYVLLITNGIDLVNFSFIGDKTIRLILEFLIQIVGFTVINILIYNLIYSVKKRNWIKNNKDKFFQGKWLHIHGKDNVRIGVVDIKQNFLDVEITAFNISPDGYADKGKTHWNHIDSEINPVALGKNVKLFGCYATERSDFSIKQGIHSFNSVECDSNGFPVKLSGNFRNCLSFNEKKVKDIADEMGTIVFHKMSDRLYSYLYPDGSFKDERLAKILENADFQNEPFVEELKKTMQKHQANAY